MLSTSSAQVVKATLPVVRAHGEAITGTFYQRMLEARPELLNLFNRANQATGEQRQALAAAVVAYAEHLLGDSPVPFAPVFERIAQKHVSLGITPADYTIVGKHLLAAVGEVLGDAVTPEIAAAWDETYWLLACELIAREARLYHTAGAAEPADVWQHWRVVDRTAETDDVVSFTLVPADGAAAPRHIPGQYVSVAVELGEGRGRQIRQYSLSGPPGAGYWQITVKRVRATGAAPQGMVSTFLHDDVHIGDLLRLSVAAGDVDAAAGDGPLLLVSAGIGLTPAMSALEHVAVTSPRRPVVLVHADRSRRSHAMRHRLPRLHTQLDDLTVRLWYEEHPADTDPAGLPAQVATGRVDPDQIPLHPDAHVHLCGPVPFMSHVRQSLLRRGVPAERIAYEVFGPDMLRAAQV
ncbi:FAD-binding oxidoreductase [Catellatospora coxensis]|uniref:globin domain-containing protein n=1 Tax=Catellatospora coxensis TaxID=310354 RepID=UPI0031DEF6F4